jgi:hypothetical protein
VEGSCKEGARPAGTAKKDRESGSEIEGRTKVRA